MSSNAPAVIGFPDDLDRLAGLLPAMPRKVGKALDTVHYSGLLKAAQVQTAAYVAHVALQEVGSLSIEEAVIAECCPHAAGRAKLIVDSFAVGAGRRIAQMGF